MQTETEKEEQYQRLIAELYTQSPSYQIVGGNAYHPGMKTMQDFDSLLGHPHLAYKTIHVAGTNGKGSVSHFLASVLSAHGYKVGLYTSPHLLDFRERIKIVSGKHFELVGKSFVVSFLEKYEHFIATSHPSFFEITTAMAFDYFAHQKVDMAVVETGLGGRLDSTNIITPILSIITSIGMDHADLLGHTLTAIAGEKAGIIKPEIPVVVGEVSNEVEQVFRDVACKVGAPVSLASEYEEPTPVRLSDMDLQGEYQTCNLRTLFTALTIIESITGRLLDRDKVYEAICHTAQYSGLRGRWDVLSHEPMIICDIAHNEHGLRPVMAQLKQLYDSGKYGRLIMIYGMVTDKDIDSVIPLLPTDAYYYFTNAKGSRAMPASQLAAKIALKGEITSSVEEAFKRYLVQSSPNDLVYIGGSSYVVAEALL